MLQRPTLTLGTVGLLLFGAVSATQAAEFGTREDANAMLDKAIAAVKEDKEKALAMFNNGESGFKDRDRTYSVKMLQTALSRPHLSATAKTSRILVGANYDDASARSAS
jgi:hypothetical protein